MEAVKKRRRKNKGGFDGGLGRMKKFPFFPPLGHLIVLNLFTISWNLDRHIPKTHIWIYVDPQYTPWVEHGLADYSGKPIIPIGPDTNKQVPKIRFWNIFIFHAVLVGLFIFSPFRAFLSDLLIMSNPTLYQPRPIARFVRWDFYYIKLGTVSWVQNCPRRCM